MNREPPNSVILHAGCISLSGRGLLILGPSGSGKSGLALQLMAFGCAFVADDRTFVSSREATLIAMPPRGIHGQIEARGVGILAAENETAARVVLAVDLGQEERERLPPWRVTEVLGVELPLLHRVESAHFPAAIMQYLKAGRIE
ncbi:HPr kinase/phosphorylase [Albidovulum aquaemixtae]|uniref:HPr kinase/phosphorylase n=1 Tax=Albidovulum aquaemixtae TaxID=1542388 RepID=UPI000D54B77A|nr:HPr kinase/phosphatase C-terminal domain-containing protein [Defluviimonas aquaemixtae]